ncbi:MAG TPA: LysE family translocator [Steroidobacter sp.]|uniref:LysE family translocator n=1 Tax=Steroidobacter sp. TaxID=1978227 RepID=UPI002EDB8052
MSLYGLLVFSAVYALAVASPGPGVAAVIARSLANGTRGAPAFIAGFLVGDLIWFAFAATGLAALAQSAHAVFVAVKYAGAAYLLYLAYKMWTSPAVAADNTPGLEKGQKPFQLFLGSLALTLANPKTMVFFLALLPTVVSLERLTLLGFAEMVVAISILLPLTFSAYVVLADRARRVFKSTKAVRRINRGTGAAMACAAVVVATR